MNRIELRRRKGLWIDVGLFVGRSFATEGDHAYINFAMYSCCCVVNPFGEGAIICMVS